MAATPELISPLDAAVARLESMLFSWEPLDGGADIYALQIASDAGLATIVTQVETTLTEVEATFPAGNIYYWRVQAKDGGSTITSLSAREFSAPPFSPAILETHVEDGKARVLSQFQAGA